MMCASIMLMPHLVDGALEPMTWRARIFVALLGVAVLVYVVNLVRTRKLKEEYAILWLFAAVVLVIQQTQHIVRRYRSARSPIRHHVLCRLGI